MYAKYQDLCLYYEEARLKIGSKDIKTFLTIKNPTKLEHHIGIVMLYLVAFLDKTIRSCTNKSNQSNTDFTLHQTTWTHIITSLRQMSSTKLFNYFKITRKELETYTLGSGVVREMDRYLHSIPGMKFSTTSANSPNTNKMYEFVYKVYELAKFLQEICVRMDSTIIPEKLATEKKANLRHELSVRTLMRHNKDG